MKKPAILVLALVFAVVACFAAWRTLRAERITPLERNPGTAADSGQHARELDPIERGPGATSSRSRLDALSGHARGVGVPEPKSKLRALRVRVAYASGIDEHAQDLAVRVCNRTGYATDVQASADREFRANEMMPGMYTIAVTAKGFRRNVVRAELTADASETVVDVALRAERVVRVRWQTADHEPISVALTKAEIDPHSVQLAVHASVAPIRQDGPAPERMAFASIKTNYLVGHDEDGRHYARKFHAGDELPESADPKTPLDAFGQLAIDEPGRLWMSAWFDGTLIDTQPLEFAQDEVVFTTRVEDMAVAQGVVALRILADDLETPIVGATIVPNGETAFEASLASHDFDPIETASSNVTDEHGHVELPLTSGWTILTVSADGFAASRLRVHVLAGQRVDLGTIGLHRDAGALVFHVVDATGKSMPWMTFELARLASYDGTAAPYDRITRGSDQDGNLTFDHVAPQRYVLRCITDFVDAVPQIIEPSAFTTGVGHVQAEIVLTNTSWVSFVFDPPLAQGTLLMLETPDGLPLRTLQTNEFGVVATRLRNTSYSLHLVEYGWATPAVGFAVDSDPFVFEVSR